jgi:hypothetical protein
MAWVDLPALRSMLRSAGTLAGNDNEWCYVSARRFFNMIEESVKKPTYAITWIHVTSMTKNFLTQKWCDGGRQGAEQVDFLTSFEPWGGQYRTCHYNDPSRDLSPRSTRRSRSVERLKASGCVLDTCVSEDRTSIHTSSDCFLWVLRALCCDS